MKSLSVNSARRFLTATAVLCISFASEAQSLFSKIYHNSTARYNLYFNSKMLVEDAIEKTQEGHKDDFTQVIELYAYGDEALLKGNASAMDEVMKKLSTLIEKHGKSKWVDDSYFLMGKSHFFKGDFYAAIDLFEYINSNYKGKPITYETDLWILKGYLMLKNIEDAEALYTKLKNKSDFPEKLKTDLNIAGAAIYIKEKKYTSAVKLLEAALPNIKNKNQKIRINYALGQLYLLTGKSAQANERFTKVVKLNPPYDFAFNAKISIAKAINPKSKGDIRQAKSLLKNMLKDDKNIDYFDKIYYELGNLEILDKNPSQALEYYKLSLSSKTNDQLQKSNTYLAVAELYFKNQDYEYAQLYYDSAARAIDPSHPDYNTISERNEVLNDLIKHLVTIKQQDSLLRLSEDEKLRERIIDKMIKEERDKAAAEKMKAENQVQQNQNNDMQMAATGSTFPFYNQAARNRGYSEFVRLWGGRELKDNWRISSISTLSTKEITPPDGDGSDTVKTEEINPLLKNASEERKKYYENIPVTKEQKARALYSIHESYYMAANVYYQSLGESEKALKLLEELLRKYPGNEFEPNAWYLMSKIYRDKGDIIKSAEYRTLLEQKYPKSNFIAILDAIENPDTTASSNRFTTGNPETNPQVEQNYRSMLTAYKSGNYAEAKAIKAENDKNFAGNSLQSRFDYLDALISAAEGDLNAYQTKLQAIIDNYPETDVAAQADRNMAALRAKTTGSSDAPAISDGIYTYKKNEPLWYVMFIPLNINSDKVKSAITEYNTTYHSNDNLQLTSSILDDKNQMVIVNNFADGSLATKYLKNIRTDNGLLQNAGLTAAQASHALISQENFTKLLQDKKLDVYLQFFNKYYK